MPEILNCPACGGTNQLPENKTSMFCAYCGKGIEKETSKNAFPEPTSNPQIANFLELARNAEQSKDYNEATSYYNKALEYNPKLSEAWFGKAYCSGESATLNTINIAQVVANYKKAVEYADSSEKKELKERVLVAINNFAISLYENSFHHTTEYASLDGTYQEHLNRVHEIIEALEYAHTIDPNNTTIKRSLVDIAKGVKKPIYYNDYDKRFRFLNLNRTAKRQMQEVIDKYSEGAAEKSRPGEEPRTVEELEKEIAAQKKRNKWGYIIFIGFGLLLIIIGLRENTSGFIGLALTFGLGGPAILYLSSLFVIKDLEKKKKNAS